ncbi:transporter [Rhizobium laguerreae]|uniref:Transporter n=1 Tax=Rhizobium laguerreae TaxID=1076926 RepID=A0AB35FPW9_9HYPH|nr:transporter [Rhizobium laguerreae]MBY3068222.1 transporter [Rhizobium laguerreae]MBY3082076.1 transporter [Rhizobium laguerreae]MBY3110485.1 transporter [Rhizobium laguerreae]NKM15525.1 transporter [Rhizobium laguerreae]NNH85808.1 transporter [Rhizobium laguerreae]
MTTDAPIRFLIILAADEGDDSRNIEIRLARIAPPYYAFKDLPAEVALATPLGGFPGMLEDLRNISVPEDNAARRFFDDRAARDDLADTLCLDQVEPDDFDAAFCIGFSGSMWGDDSLGITNVIKSLLVARKPVALIPGRNLDLVPDGAGAGLLILGESDESTLLAAHALIAVAAEQRQLPEGAVLGDMK